MSASGSSELVNWNAYSTWNLVLPPNRPSDWQIDTLSLLLQTRQPTSICILGSTPEYRQVTGLTTAKVHIVDKNKAFSCEMDSFCTPNSNEIRVVSDWISHLRANIGTYDFVLSHFTHGNIEFSRRVDFFDAIRNSLKPCGIFFDAWFNPRPTGQSANELERRFQRQPINLRTANDFNCLAIFQSDQIPIIGHIDTSHIYAHLESTLTFRGAPELIALTKLVTPLSNRWHYHPSKPPAYFDYYNKYRVIQEMPEAPESAFAGAAQLSVLERVADP